jgi:hypothetical protein
VAEPGNTIVAGTLDSSERKVLLEADSKAVFAPPGYVLFVRQSVLMAQRFDPSRLELVGEAVPIGQTVRTNPQFGSAAFAASDNGVLVYSGGLSALPSQLEWFDRSGHAFGNVEDIYDYRGLTLSPDGTRVVAHRHEEPVGGGLWVTDLRRARPRHALR